MLDPDMRELLMRIYLTHGLSEPIKFPLNTQAIKEGYLAYHVMLGGWVITEAGLKALEDFDD